MITKERLAQYIQNFGRGVLITVLILLGILNGITWLLFPVAPQIVSRPFQTFVWGVNILCFFWLLAAIVEVERHWGSVAFSGRSVIDTDLSLAALEFIEGLARNVNPDKQGTRLCQVVQMLAGYIGSIDGVCKNVTTLLKNLRVGRDEGFAEYKIVVDTMDKYLPWDVTISVTLGDEIVLQYYFDLQQPLRTATRQGDWKNRAEAQK